VAVARIRANPSSPMEGRSCKFARWDASPIRPSSDQQAVRARHSAGAPRCLRVPSRCCRGRFGPGLFEAHTRPAWAPSGSRATFLLASMRCDSAVHAIVSVIPTLLASASHTVDSAVMSTIRWQAQSPTRDRYKTLIQLSFRAPKDSLLRSINGRMAG
jgi:hypothetical protein